MGTRSWLNLVLLLVVLALAALVYFEPGKQPQETVLLTTLNPDTVQQIRIERPDKEPLVFQREGDGWRLLEPVAAAAKPFYVDQVLALLKQESLQRYPAQGLDLSKYGLQQPRARLIVDGVELSFGRINPLNSRLYVMVDDVMHMVAQNDISILTDDWTDYVSTALLPDNDLAMLEIPGLGKLEHGKDGWRFDGFMAPASEDQVQALVDAWRNAKALLVRPAVESGTAEKISVLLRSGTKIEFGVYKTEDALVLQRPELGIEYVFDASQSGRLLQWPALAGAEDVHE